MNAVSIVVYVLLIAAVDAFAPRGLVRPAVGLQCSSLKMSSSSFSELFSASSMTLAEQKVNIDPYETTGVPPVFLVASVGLVVLFGLIPVISRKNQVKKNSRTLDEAIAFDQALEEKLTDREKLGDSYDSSGSVGRYTKD